MCSNWFSFFFYSILFLSVSLAFVALLCTLKVPFKAIHYYYLSAQLYRSIYWTRMEMWMCVNCNNFESEAWDNDLFFANVHAVQNVVEKNLICANIQVFICESMVSMHVFCDRHHWILTQFDGVLVLGFWNMQPNVQLVGTEGWYSNENIIYKLHGLNNFHWYLLFRYFTHMCMYAMRCEMHLQTEK